MRKYLHKFESLADFNTAYNGNDYHEPGVSYTTYDQAISFTASISRSGGEFGPYDGTFYTETNSMSVESTTITGPFYIWKNNNDEYIATTTRVITEGMYYEHASKLGETGGTMGATNIGDNKYTLINVSSVVNETKGVVGYNKKLPVYDFIIDCSSGDAGNGLKITYMNPSFGPYEEVEIQTDPSFYGYIMENISSIILKQTLSVQILNSEGGPTEIVVPSDQTEGTDYSWSVSGSGGETYIYLEHNNSSFDEGGVLRILHINAG